MYPILTSPRALCFGLACATLAGCSQVSQKPTDTAAIRSAADKTTEPPAMMTAAAQQKADFTAIDRLQQHPYPFETEEFLQEPQQSATAKAAEDTTATETQTSADLWQLTRDGMALDLGISHPRIDAQLNWFKKHPRYLTRVSDRAKRYYYYVLHEVLKRGMPAELALLPVVESAYDPFAYSHGRAAGPWQFIPGTAKYYGLRKSWWYDGRRDIQASTQAALTYLSKLHERFGDWQLALAAYNAGGGTVSKAIRYNKKRNKPTDFFSLRLPRETTAYVPKLLALSQVIKDPEAYGITLTSIPNEPYFASVDVGSQIDLAQAAELAGISTNELYLLNPGFNQWATDPEGPHSLLVPFNSAGILQANLETLAKSERLSWQRYTIRAGDTLSGIAKRHRTTISAITSANNIRGHLIRQGQTLLIPTASQGDTAYALSSGQRQQQKNARMAQRSDKTKLTHRVRSGDSFWSIAKRYDVGVRELARWNQMAPGDTLSVGKKLIVWQEGGSAQLARSGIEDKNRVRKIGYKVRNGDSLWHIANRFNVSVNDIQRWNGGLQRKKYLKPGQALTLYIDITRAH